MSEPFTVLHGPGRLTRWIEFTASADASAGNSAAAPDMPVKRDWMAEFAPEPAPKSRLLADTTTLPVLTYTALPSVTTTSRERARTGTRRLILLSVSAMVLMISASSAMVSLWMRLALAPVPPAEWPVSPPPLAPSPALVTSSELAASALEPAPQPAAETTPAVAVPITTPAPSVAAVAKAPAPAVAAGDPAASAVATPDPAPAAPGASEVSAILSVLDRYRLASSSLNPGSVRAVWPAADVRALAREFGEIKRQTLAFDDCRIDVQGVQAEAACAGRVSLVTKARHQGPTIQLRRWVFTLVRQNDAWTITRVESNLLSQDDDGVYS